MKKRGLRRSIRHFGRYQEVLRVLVNYGFRNIVEQLQTGIFTDIRQRVFPQRPKKEITVLGTAARLRLAFQDLGPTFIKLGQVLSVRPDLIPPNFAQEFSKLQDEIPPNDFAEVKILIESVYKKEIKEVFREFDNQAIAAASLAQVHKAKLPDGTNVAVKVLRPRIQKVIEIDLEILSNLAEVAEKYLAEARFYDLPGIVREFTRTIRKEQNLIYEGRHIDIFRRKFEDDPTVYIPKVHWDYTNEKILVTEFIKGIKISDLAAIEKAGMNRREIAKNGANLLLKQVFDLGFFHADPHPGNLFVLPGDLIAPVDFGMVGRIDDDTREALMEILRAIVDRDAYKIARVLLNIGVVEKKVNMKNLERDILDNLDRYYGVPLQQIDASLLITELMELVHTHHIHLPADLVLMGRAIIISESVGRGLDPDFNLFEFLIPYTRKFYFARFNPFGQFNHFTRMLDETVALMRALPDDVRTILHKIKQDEFAINFYHQGLENLTREIDRASNRVAFSLIIAAIVIASSLVIIFNRGPFLFGYPAIGIIGYFIASLLGLWLITSILRSGKL
ncbi:MAG: AarF/ABC1/UbiB kinase family protein [Calditrichia bacterium]